MAVPLSNIITVNVSSGSPAVQGVNFDVPLALVNHAEFSDLVRYYGSLTEVADDFDEGTAAHDIAEAMFRGDGTSVPARIAIGKLPTLITKIITFTPVAENGRTYTLEVNGQVASFTADSSATVAEICTGLVAAIDALSIAGITATNNTTNFTVSAAAGVWFTAETTMQPSLLAVADSSTIAGGDYSASISAALNAIVLESNDWYGLCMPYGAKAAIMGAQAWVAASASPKTYIFQSQDSNNITLATGSDSDASAMKHSQSLTYQRGMVMFHHRTSQFAAAQWLAAGLSKQAGSVQFAYFNLPGVEASPLTNTHITNIEAKDGNYYASLTGVGSTFNGITPAGTPKWMDKVRDRDWLVNRLQVLVANLLLSVDKIPFTDAGILQIVSKIREGVGEAKRNGILQNDTPAVFDYPKASEVSSTDRENRILRDISVSDRFAGAILKIVLNVTLAD